MNRYPDVQNDPKYGAMPSLTGARQHYVDIGSKNFFVWPGNKCQPLLACYLTQVCAVRVQTPAGFGRFLSLREEAHAMDALLQSAAAAGTCDHWSPWRPISKGL